MQPFHHRPGSPATPDSPAFEKDSQMIGIESVARQMREDSEDVLRQYEAHRNRLSKGIDESKYALAQVKNFGREHSALVYPSQVRGRDGEQLASSSSRPASRRTLTGAHEAPQPVNGTPTPARQIPKRSLTSFPPQTAPPTDEPTELDDMSILRLDLNMGAARQASTVISHLERASLAKLIEARIDAALEHLSHLQNRIQDAHSRVLVTGDLNAGKSTFCNALLRRHEVMPTDEQPLTTRFVEVISASENEGKEEVHVLDQGEQYEPGHKSSYSVESVEKLSEMVTDTSVDADSPPIRVFLNEAKESSANPSILHNGVVDISLIDAPGLNRDSIKTTANFARQEEIDVVVFVVSAANHFTLSAKEFIWQAGQEKAHLFIVVNRYDQIRDKERCRRKVLEQIKQLSPSTYADADDLVHFVDSAKVAYGFSDESDEGDAVDEAFSRLEHSLRSFVLVNRSKSKLGPAENYLAHLLGDVEVLAHANELVAKKEREEAKAEISRVKPELEKMQRGSEGLDEALLVEAERATELSKSRTQVALTRALERIGRGELAVAGPGLTMPAYPGLLGVWDYATEIKRVFLLSLDYSVHLAENDARRQTTEAVGNVEVIANRHLPADAERTRRKFVPEAMFTPRGSRSGALRRRSSGYGSNIGLGLAGQSHLLEVNVNDILNLQRMFLSAQAYVPFHLPMLPSPASASSSTALVPFGSTELGVMSLGAGLLFGAKTIGIPALLDGVLKFTDILSHPSTRRLLPPALAVGSAGLVGWIIYDLPQSIPRNVGKNLQAVLLLHPGLPIGVDGEEEQEGYADWQSRRVGREVRKVMDLASLDVKHTYGKGVEKRKDTMKECEAVVRQCEAVVDFFEGIGGKLGEIRALIGIEGKGGWQKVGPKA